MGVAGRVAALAPQMPEIMALDPRRRRQRLFVGFFAVIAAPRMLADLTTVFDSFQPDVVIHEMAELAAAPLAAGRGIAHLTVAFSGALHQSVLDGALDHGSRAPSCRLKRYNINSVPSSNCNENQSQPSCAGSK